jgi:YegS/Rv2252/BmrU family lipid kinase
MSAVPVVLNCNAGSGGANDIGDQVRDAFRDAGLECEVIRCGAKDEDVSGVAMRAARGAAPMVVAAGGDGTINAVATALIGTDTTLGVLPLGTLNHFARDLGIPDDLREAVRTLVEGRDARIDAGEVNGRIFLNNSSLGLYPSLVHHRNQQQLRLGRGKWPALFWSALLMLRRYPLLRVRVDVEGAQMTLRTPLVFVGNNDYNMSGLDIGIRERIDAGTLSLYIPRLEGRWALVRIALRALFRRLRRADDFVMLRARDFSIDTTRKYVRVATDGEIAATTTPLRYRILPGALKVRVPASKA